MSLSVSLSFEQKVAYAERSLGVDLQKDSRQLFDVVQTMLEKPLPEPWRPSFDEHWRLFFYNDRTKVSVWSHPMRPAHQRLVDAHRRIETATDRRAAVRLELEGFQQAAEAEWQQWRESQSDGRTFYFHRATRQTTWEDPAELIRAQLALEVDMLNLAFEFPRTSEPEDTGPVTEVSDEAQQQPRSPETPESETQSWLPSQLPSPRARASLGTVAHLQEALVVLPAARIEEVEALRQRQAIATLRAAARRWLCQQQVADLAAQQAAQTVQCFLQRWLSWRALLNATEQDEAVEVASDNDTEAYSSDYEAGSSQSRSQEQSPRRGESGGSSRDPFIAALSDPPIQAEAVDATSQRPKDSPERRRWEGVFSSHWASLPEMPELEVPEIPEAPLNDFQSQAETFVNGLGRDSKGFEHLLEVARAQLEPLPLHRESNTTATSGVRRKVLRRVTEDFRPQNGKHVEVKALHKDVASCQVPAATTELASEGSTLPFRELRWEKRVLELLAESPKRAEAPTKRGSDIGAGYALKELAKSADKARELKKTLQKDHREVYSAYSNVFQQLKVLEHVKLPKYPNTRPKVKAKARPRKASVPNTAARVLARQASGQRW